LTLSWGLRSIEIVTDRPVGLHKWIPALPQTRWLTGIHPKKSTMSVLQKAGKLPALL
jgi:hypothetical protein